MLNAEKTKPTSGTKIGGKKVAVIFIFNTLVKNTHYTIVCKKCFSLKNLTNQPKFLTFFY